MHPGPATRHGDAARILHERSRRETWAPQRRLVPREGLALAQGRAARVAASSRGGSFPRGRGLREPPGMAVLLAAWRGRTEGT